MDLTEKTVSSEKIFDGKILHIRRDVALLPDGQEAVREVVDHPGGVCVLALDGENQALLVRQFRYPYMQELREETGAVAGKFQSLGELYPSPGYCGEIIRMYLAQDLRFGETDLDEDEFLTLERIPFSQLVQEVMDGKIKDAKTIAAALKAKTLLHL